MPKTEAAVKRADAALRRFKEQNQVVVLEQEAESAVRLIASLEEQITQARARLSDLTARLQTLQARIGLDSRQALVLSELSQANGVQEVLSQLQQAQQQLVVEQTRYRSGYPSIANLERRITALKNLLQERIQQKIGSSQSIAESALQVSDLQRDLIGQLIQAETERSGLQQQLTALTTAQANYKSRASVLPRLEETQRELERKLQAAQTTYETLLTRLQEIQVAENQSLGNARVISPALTPKSPSSSRSYLLLIGGTGAGLLLAIATAFVADLIDRSIKTVKEARETFGYTLLGVIPLFSSVRERNSYSSSEQSDHLVPRVVSRDIPTSPVAEAYQMLQANLRFLSSDKELKRIVVTSSVAKEGKSEVAANLAMAMAQVGRRVLLVDANMRHPIQHHIWNLTNVIGLSNVLVEQATLETAVQQVATNLDVLLAGVVPPNPMALLDSNRMEALVDYLAETYDFVIFDTPPLAGTADAAVLGQLVDGTLLVARPGIVDLVSAQAAKEFLVQSGQHMLGMVINGVNMKIEPDSYFYYVKKQSEHMNVNGTTAAESFISLR